MRSGGESDEIVAKIENTSRETVDNMSDIVWSIEPANDRFDNVLRKMTYFGEQLMGSLGIEFTFNYEPGIEKTTFDMARRKNIYLIYKEAINNAAKYSAAKNVQARLWKEGRLYSMEIKDDGKGFDITSNPMGNGLRNMKRRAEEMGGTLTIESSDKGTTITLKV
jgi:signal transduction histidine kinase